MKTADKIKHHFMPWAGLVGGMGGAGLAHQVGSEGMFNDCAAVSPGPILIVSLIGLALTAAGAFASLRVYREKSDRSSRHLIATVSLGLAALFAMAILLPMVASLVIPPCYM